MKFQPTFLDRFTLHLAAKLLLDPERIQTWLRDHAARANDESSTPCLYWRSPLLHELEASDAKTATTPILAFVDLTFDLTWMSSSSSSSSSSPALQVRFGYFFLQPEQSESSSRYYQSKPLTRTLLDQYARSIRIELDEASPPQAMASLLAQALTASMTTESARNVSVFEHHLHDEGLWYYPDIDECGKWKLPIEFTSKLDAVAMRLLYCNIMQPAPHSSKEDSSISLDPSDEVLLERRLQECWDLLEERRLDGNKTKDERGPLAVPSSVRSGNHGGGAETSTAHSNVATKRAAGPYAPVVSGTKKRKNKGKITYAKPG